MKSPFIAKPVSINDNIVTFADDKGTIKDSGITISAITDAVVSKGELNTIDVVDTGGKLKASDFKIDSGTKPVVVPGETPPPPTDAIGKIIHLSGSELEFSKDSVTSNKPIIVPDGELPSQTINGKQLTDSLAPILAALGTEYVSGTNIPTTNKDVFELQGITVPEVTFFELTRAGTTGVFNIIKTVYHTSSTTPTALTSSSEVPSSKLKIDKPGGELLSFDMKMIKSSDMLKIFVNVSSWNPVTAEYTLKHSYELTSNSIATVTINGLFKFVKMKKY